ncbi:LacI family transcriptional regulator [Pectobacterium cacticida]|uniref:LacI family DNA-binding transcriptional regulator n=1 Tax=Pectobacterium cacticida TaxID=69221 RepID=A0ABZ2GDF8_9GAMM|nr:LacI family DNA-binding transcriptional regulator [Pectobacterium cacticida]UYX05736.1 LacI family transcriptional regulator [Pectobacterium cacticida]
MTTLKDVAKLANVSLSTVSIIVNGKQEARKISPETCEKVINAIRTLGYVPNLNARKIRYSERSRPKLVLFWPFDSRTNILSSLLTEIHLQLHKTEFNFELVIQTYDNDKIEQSIQEIIKDSCNGIIVAGASHKDIECLESVKINSPVILINRDSKKYSMVYVDPHEIASSAIDVLKKKNITDIVIVGIKNSFIASNQRTKIFMEYCESEGITIKNNHFIRAHNSFDDGINIAKEYLRLSNRPKTIFCESDIVASGMIYHFNKVGIDLPDEVFMLAIGTVGGVLTKYLLRDITVIEVPADKIARAIVNVFINKFQSKDILSPVRRKVSPEIHIVGSCSEG